MKTIAFVCPWYGDDIPGGAEAALRGVTAHLHEAGMDIEIITTTVQQFTADWNKNYYKPGVTKNASGIPVRRFKIRKRNTKEFDNVNAKLINHAKLTLEEENVFNREMINSPDMYQYIRENKDKYAFFVYIPYLFGTTYHGVSACPEKSVLIPCFHDEAYAHMQTFKEMYSTVAGMLFNSQPEEELTENLYDITNIKTEVMGLGVNTNLTYDANAFRDKYHIQEPYILYAGRKDEGKNIDTLLHYFERYKKHYDGPLKLVLIGGGQIKISDIIKDDIVDLGFVDIQDKYNAYGAAELLCQPSKNESFSFVIMESWLCDRPVLVHEECEVTKNFVRESNGGLYFGDYYQFQSAVDYMMSHTKESAIMGKQGRAYVMKHFAWNVIVEKYEKFFKELEEKN